MYNHNPEHHAYAENFDIADTKKPVRLITEFRGDKVSMYTGVLVECWHHKNYGKVKRAYIQEFTEQERKVLGRLHTSAYNWVMRTGHPEYISMKLETFDLLVRAANFFASN